MRVDKPKDMIGLGGMFIIKPATVFNFKPKDMIGLGECLSTFEAVVL